MCLLIESIKVFEGKAENLTLHQERMHRSIFELFGTSSEFDLEELFNQHALPQQLHKCRIVYSVQIQSFTLIPYKYRKPVKFRIVYDDEIDYSHKYFDRMVIDKLFALRDDADEIIIVKHGFVTDTSIANLVFVKDSKWYTPKSPLLCGTRRTELLRKNRLLEIQISVSDIAAYDSFFPLNTMTDLKQIQFIPVENIRF